MSNNYNKYTDDYFDDYFDKDFNNTKKVLNKKRRGNIFKNNNGRKGLKWALLRLAHNKFTWIITLVVVAVIAILIIVPSKGNEQPTAPIATEPQPSTVITNSHHITGVPVIPQDEYLACCESYACTMLMQYLGFDLEIGEFVNNYLIVKPVEYGADGNRYGPDLNSAFGGDLYFGFGINAPAMAKCMNNYLKAENSNLKAYPLIGTPLEQLCEEYVNNDIPVMVWATAGLQEPYVKASWSVNYVDENSDKKIGDTMDWLMHEHCMVLIGYDEDNYYFSDSVAGEVSVFDRETTEERYAQIGTQAIVVK